MIVVTQCTPDTVAGACRADTENICTFYSPSSIFCSFSASSNVLLLSTVLPFGTSVCTRTEHRTQETDHVARGDYKCTHTTPKGTLTRTHTAVSTHAPVSASTTTESCPLVPLRVSPTATAPTCCAGQCWSPYLHHPGRPWARRHCPLDQQSWTAHHHLLQ